MEVAADLESLYMASKATHHKAILETGFPKSSALEYAKSLCSEELKYRGRSAALVEALKSRGIKLSQSLKLNEVR